MSSSIVTRSRSTVQAQQPGHAREMETSSGSEWSGSEDHSRDERPAEGARATRRVISDSGSDGEVAFPARARVVRPSRLPVAVARRSISQPGPPAADPVTLAGPDDLASGGARARQLTLQL